METFNALDEGVLANVARFLEVKDVVQLILTSKYLNSTFSNGDTAKEVWQDVYKRFYAERSSESVADAAPSVQPDNALFKHGSAVLRQQQVISTADRAKSEADMCNWKAACTVWYIHDARVRAWKERMAYSKAVSKHQVVGSELRKLQMQAKQADQRHAELTAELANLEQARLAKIATTHWHPTTVQQKYNRLQAQEPVEVEARIKTAKQDLQDTALHMRMVKERLKRVQKQEQSASAEVQRLRISVQRREYG